MIRGGRARRNAIILGVLVGLTTAVVVSGPLTAGDGGPRTGEELYDALAIAAQQGDRPAAEQIAAIDAFLTERGLDRDVLTVPESSPAIEESRVGGASLAVEDGSPWRITIDNRTAFQTSDELAIYLARRHSVLATMAAEDPARRVEAVVHPSRRQAASAFLAAIVCPCEGISLIVDVYGPQGWMMASGIDAGRTSVRNAPGQLEAMVLEQSAVSLDLFPGVTRSELRAEIRSVRLEMSAQSAFATAGLDSVLLVDLTTDLADAHAGRAALIEVAGMPDVTEAHRRLVLGDPVGANPVEPARR